MIYVSVMIVALLVVSILASGVRIAKTIGRRDIPAASPGAAFELVQAYSENDFRDSEVTVDRIEQLISDLIAKESAGSTVTHARHYYTKTFNSSELGLGVDGSLKFDQLGGGGFFSEPTAYKITPKPSSNVLEAAKIYNFRDYKKEAQK